MEGIASDRVNIHLGGGGNDSGASTAAVIAALGSRNQADISPAILASLGNRNQADMTPALVAALAGHRDSGRHDDGFGFGGGGGIVGLLIALGLLGRRGGFGGGDDCGNDEHGRTAILQTLMEGQADLRAQVPTSALEIQNQVCSAISQLALGIQQGLANNKDAFQNGLLAELAAIAGVKDTIQNGFALTNNNILEGVCSVKQTVRDDGDKTRSQIALYHEANLQRELAVAQNALSEERHSRRIRDVEVSVSQNVNQQQGQWQTQRIEDDRFNRLFGAFNSLANQVQVARNVNDTINFGTMAASGIQTTPTTQVR